MASRPNHVRLTKGEETSRGRGLPGKDIDVSEPLGTAKDEVHGGTITDWERIDRLLMRRRMTGTLLLSVLLLIIGGLVAGVSGVAPAVLLVLATLVAGPTAIAFGYYFRADIKE